MTLRVGKTATYPLAPKTTFAVEAGALNIFSEMKGNTLTIKALSAGEVRVRLNTPGAPARVIALELVEAAPAPTTQTFGSGTLSPAEASDKPAAVQRLVSPQVVQRPPAPGTMPQVAPLSGGPVPAAGAPTTPATAAAPATGLELFPPEFGLGGAPATTASPTSEFPANPIPPQNLPPQVFPPTNVAPKVELTPQTVPNTTLNPAPNTLIENSQLGNPVTQLAPAAPDRVAPTKPAVKTPAANANKATPNPDNSAKISSPLPLPATNLNPVVSYKTTPKLPPSFNQKSATQKVEVSQGLARLLTFRSNILSVFFSDPNAMDARAINARTIAVTGTGPGQSTLAVFTERYPGDAVGYASVYRVDTLARGGGAPAPATDPSTVEGAIVAALNDPRIRVSVVKLPEGNLAARLTGVVRNDAEVQGALTTASFFTPRVLPSIYADPNAPSIDAVMSGAASQTPQSQLQENLRRITGNDSIELVALPGSLVFKANVDSQDEAQNLMQLLPSLNQPILPFITIRGGGKIETSNIPLLQGEDLQLTQKLQAVTNVRTVYAVRASGNSIAIYGNVLNRSQYEAVKRYGLVIAQSAAPFAVQGTTQGGSVFRPQGGEQPPLPAYDPAAGYARQLGVQMFVQITDPAESVIRNVTIETNIVEITRTNLQNLGAEYGSVTLLSENITPTTRTPQVNGDGNPVFDTNGNQLFNSTGGVTTRTIDPAFNAGTALLGNGFIGQGGIGSINPFRARINAISQKNNARVLASPNIRATEGTVAQITIGGERPVPVASSSFGATGQSIEFRRFGVILTMRPTVTDDNTIILQIRADVTQPDQTYAINVAGAIIPGESVRSIDTTITVRPGDIMVMGGLLTNDKRQQTSKVPLLGDLPIIGSLFKSKRFENNETELAIFMTPRIDAVPATMDSHSKMEVIPSFPALPGRQESGSPLFQNNTRATGG